MRKVLKIISVLLLSLGIVACGSNDDKVFQEIEDVALEDAADLLKDAGYSSSWRSSRFSDFYVTFDNPEVGNTFEIYVKDPLYLTDITYTNRNEEYDEITVYEQGMHIGDQEAIESYLKELKDIGLNREIFMSYAIAYLVEDNPDLTAIETSPKNNRSSEIENDLKEANYLTAGRTSRFSDFYVTFDNPILGVYIDMYIKRGNTVDSIVYTNRFEEYNDIKIFSDGKYIGDQEIIDDYFETLEHIVVNRDDLLEYAIDYIDDYQDILSPKNNRDTDTETNTDIDTDTDSDSDTDNSDNDSTASGENTDLTRKINEIDKKYDDLIKKGQGYIDNPSTYTLSEFTSFMEDYADLTDSYAELQTAIDNAGDSLSNSEAMTIYTNITLKTITLIEIVADLPEINY